MTQHGPVATSDPRSSSTVEAVYAERSGTPLEPVFRVKLRLNDREGSVIVTAGQLLSADRFQESVLAGSGHVFLHSAQNGDRSLWLNFVGELLEAGRRRADESVTAEEPRPTIGEASR